LARLHFDAEVLDLLPANVPAVQGLKIYQEHFANARELIITVKAPDRRHRRKAAQSIAEKLRRETNLVADATWQPPWLEHPEQTAELDRLSLAEPAAGSFCATRRATFRNQSANVLAATREQLATTLSPAEIAQLSYDPFGSRNCPQNSPRPDFSARAGIVRLRRRHVPDYFCQGARRIERLPRMHRWLQRREENA
jgi:hypothetical protein